MDLRTELAHLEPRIVPSEWPGHEHVRGYGVFGLPFSSGHVLALRVFPESDFAPYITVWHRDPAGTWSIYYQAPRADIACPRYYGAAAQRSAPASIDATWTGSAELAIHMDRPALTWRVWPRESAVLQVINAVSRRLPLWTWKHRALLAPREWMAGLLGIGRIELAGLTPSGHYGILMPQRMYFIDRSEARFEGVDLGRPTRMHPNPRIGDVPLPARGILAVGQAHWEIKDREEYERTRRELGAA